jgi:carbon storage regulator
MSALVITRKLGEKVHVGDDVVVTVIQIKGDKVRLMFEAPKEVIIHREEIVVRMRQEKAEEEKRRLATPCEGRENANTAPGESSPRPATTA